MELRKDHITQSCVILLQREARVDSPEECPLEPAKIEKLRPILTWPAEGAWQVRVLPHPDPLYHIEGEPGRVAEGMYDKMVALGAHEVVVETPLHDKRMSQFSDEEIERVLWVWAPRTNGSKIKSAAFSATPCVRRRSWGSASWTYREITMRCARMRRACRTKSG